MKSLVMEKKLKKLSKRVNFYLNNYLSKFNNSELTIPMKYYKIINLELLVQIQTHLQEIAATQLMIK